MKNKLICGDNLEALKSIGSESVDLIYIDPPFSSATMPATGVPSLLSITIPP